jgi:Protein of unknown function (DUF3311)
MSPDFPTRPIPSSGPAAPVARTDRNPWNWLLLIPITLPLLTFVYNRETPTLFGFPFFFWFQLLFAPLAVVVGVSVFYLSRRSRGSGRSLPKREG